MTKRSLFNLGFENEKKHGQRPIEISDQEDVRRLRKSAKQNGNRRKHKREVLEEIRKNTDMDLIKGWREERRSRWNSDQEDDL